MDLNKTLLYAIENHDLNLAEVSISQGADVNHAVREICGESILMEAINVGDLEMIKLLLRNGADVYKEYHISGISGSADINAITFARYWIKNEYIANFLEYSL